MRTVHSSRTIAACAAGALLAAGGVLMAQAQPPAPSPGGASGPPAVQAPVAKQAARPPRANAKPPVNVDKRSVARGAKGTASAAADRSRNEPKKSLEAAAKEAAPAKSLSPYVGQHFSTPGKGPAPWRIRRATWTGEDEKAFEAFVQQIGESNCATVHECLTDPQANPRYHALNPPGMRFVADCAE